MSTRSAMSRLERKIRRLIEKAILEEGVAPNNGLSFISDSCGCVMGLVCVGAGLYEPIEGRPTHKADEDIGYLYVAARALGISRLRAEQIEIGYINSGIHYEEHSRRNKDFALGRELYKDYYETKEGTP